MLGKNTKIGDICFFVSFSLPQPARNNESYLSSIYRLRKPKYMQYAFARLPKNGFDPTKRRSMSSSVIGKHMGLMRSIRQCKKCGNDIIRSKETYSHLPVKVTSRSRYTNPISFK